ncbi:MAG TPA: hypothetical protein VHO67_15515, partial [Polyangia bacterium]|nr:hypothetical protein [Polyangia bacterium]
GIGLQLVPKRAAEAPRPAWPTADASAGRARDGATTPPHDGAADAADARPTSDGASDLVADGAGGEARPSAGPDAAAVPPGKEVAAPKPGDPERPTDKDIAREAWRHNVPDVRVEDVRASLLVPLKGSSEGATFHITNRPHAVIVKLPKAAALITMKLYRLKKHGFKQLWIYQNETDAKPEDGTVLKVIVTDPGPPEVEIRDDFVRITIRDPAAGPPEVAE